MTHNIYTVHYPTPEGHMLSSQTYATKRAAWRQVFRVINSRMTPWLRAQCHTVEIRCNGKFVAWGN